MSSSFSITTTLEKMAPTTRDKDFRYMALADLGAELQKDTFKMDADSEKKITESVLRLLSDNSNQVQEQAVKCMGPLSKKIKDQHILMVDTLTGHVLVAEKGKDELRDLASISLKAVITNIPPDKADLPAQMVKRVTPRLVSAIGAKDANPDIVGTCLDVLNALLEKFGTHMTDDHESVLKVIQPELRSKRSVTRKKATSCLGFLAITTPDNIFNEMVNNLVNYIGSSKTNPEELRTYMQAISAVSRSVGYRLGKYLNDILPKVMKYCDGSNEDDELKENCFQCFESLVLRCPKDITPFLDQIQKLCLSYIGHDPNYEDPMEEDEEEEEDDDDDAENYSDDDDMSWKVRRSATKCLDAIIITRPERLQDLYANVAPVLITRFSEREENVKLDVFSTFSDLLKQTGQFARRQTESNLIGLLKALVPKIVSSVTKQMKGKQLKTRSGAFFLLKQLVTVYPGSLNDHVASLIPGIKVSLTDSRSDNSLKLETLSFLRLLFQTHDAKVFHPYVKDLTIVFKSVNDQYYRTSAEALRAVAEFVNVLRPKNAESTFDYRPYVKPLYNAVVEKLKTQEIDQEVKEAAIHCMGLILAYLGDELKTETPEILRILVERLSNEITRLTTAKSFEVLASSPLRLNLDSVIGQVLEELSSFLNRNNRQLVQTSLVTLGVIIKNSANSKPAQQQYGNVLAKLSPLISVSDLHLTHLALDLSTSILKSKAVPASLIVENQIAQKATELLKSALLGGLALESLLDFFSNLVQNDAVGFDQLLEQFVSIANTPDVSRQILANTAKAVAAITAPTDEARRKKTVERLITVATSTKEDTAKHLALFSLGEIGRLTDLSPHSNLSQTVLTAFESPSEETRQAASFAFGGIAVGNLKVYVPQVVKQIQTNSKSKYLLLHSLRDIIVRQSANQESVASLQSYQNEIIPILFAECESEEEGVRNVVAECLGKLAIVSPSQLVPALAQGASSPSHLTRGTVVSAIKFAVVDRPTPSDALLLEQIPKFLNLLSDPELIVRRNTLFTLNFVAHNKATLIREVLPKYLPALYGEAKVKPELIREVDLGPFKHRVDDGLEVRKAAYEAMYTLLDTAVDRLSIPEFISHLKEGLNDQNDIKMLCHLMIIRLSQVAGPSLLESLEQLVEPLRLTITNKPKEGSVQPDIDRNDELVRSALRAVVAVSRIPNADSIHKWEEFLRGTLKTGELADKYGNIRQEMQHTEVQTSDKMDLS